LLKVQKREISERQVTHFVLGSSDRNIHDKRISTTVVTYLYSNVFPGRFQDLTQAQRKEQTKTSINKISLQTDL
jgi:hypothetical protein